MSQISVDIQVLYRLWFFSALSVEELHVLNRSKLYPTIVKQGHGRPRAAHHNFDGTNPLLRTPLSDSCKKKGCRRWPRQTFADFPCWLRRTQAISFWSPSGPAEGTLPRFSIPRNSPAPNFWGLAHPELHGVRSARPLHARAPPSIMSPAPQFSRPETSTLRAPVRPPSAPPPAPGVTQGKETANLGAPPGGGGA